jgi:hypothetical protein
MIGQPELPLTDGAVELRPFEMSDVEDVTEACQDREISRWTDAIPWPYSEDHARDWISALWVPRISSVALTRASSVVVALAGQQ